MKFGMLIIGCLVTLSGSCSKKQDAGESAVAAMVADESFLGEWQDKAAYKNSRFGICFEVPQGWNFSQSFNFEERKAAWEDLQLLGEEGVNKVKNSNVTSLVCAVEKRNSGVKPIATLNMIIERVAHWPEVKSGKGYLDGMERFYSNSDLGMKLGGKAKLVTVGGVSFYHRSAVQSKGSVSAKVNFLARMVDGHVLSIYTAFKGDPDGLKYQELLENFSQLTHK